MPVAEPILSELKRMAGPDRVLSSAEDLIPYSFDGTAALKALPGCVVLPGTSGEVAQILKLANRTRTPVVTRGSGTGLSGGSVPTPDCLVLCTVRMDRIVELD